MYEFPLTLHEIFYSHSESFIDFRKAFDCVDRELLWKKLEEHYKIKHLTAVVLFQLLFAKVVSIIIQSCPEDIS